MKRLLKRTCLVAAIVITFGCWQNHGTVGQNDLAIANPITNSTDPPNVLLVIADDLGIDALAPYNVSKTTPRTPNLDALAASGVIFENFWVTPGCTTTRAALITGQHGFESTVDYVPAVMPDSAQTIQQRLKASDLATPYATGVFGKWHLGGPNADANHPAQFGIDHYAGNLFNLDDYTNWTLTDNGTQTRSSTYHTTKVTDLALDFIRSHTQKPWFTWVAYAAPHTPFHTPPRSLMSETTPTTRAEEQYRAMIEAMDTEIGRLMAGLPDEDKANTIIMFMGDNGSPKRGRDKQVFASDHVKGSLYEGGIRTPLIVGGGPIHHKARRENALVNATDIFATILDLATPSAEPTDVPSNSVSFRPLLDGSAGPQRRYNYSEWRTRSEDAAWTVRDATHKVIHYPDGRNELFANSDLSEQTPLNLEETSRKLLEIGQAIRSGSLVAHSPSSTPSPTEHASICEVVAGQYSHTGQDVLGSRNLNGTVSIAVGDGRCIITANGIPDHAFNNGSQPFRHDVTAQSYQLSFPLNPTRAATSTDLSLRTNNGVLLNGAKIDMLAAACFGVGDGKVGCNDPNQPWRFDPVHQANSFRIDRHLAHTQPNGAYHYHGVIDLPNQSRVIGFAADGFPIRSPYVAEAGGLRQVQSSYRLKTGQRVNPGNGTPFPGGSYDGTFRDDWEYVQGLGDLDACNGADFGDGYAYYATESFPYYVGCFVGTPDRSFDKQGGGGQNPAGNETRPTGGQNGRPQRPQRRGEPRPRR